MNMAGTHCSSAEGRWRVRRRRKPQTASSPDLVGFDLSSRASSRDRPSLPFSGAKIEYMLLRSRLRRSLSSRRFMCNLIVPSAPFADKRVGILLMASPTTITAVTSRVLDVPLPAPFRAAWGRGEVQSSYFMTLIEVHTDAGLVGITAAEARSETAVAIERFVAPYLIGRDGAAPEQLTAILKGAEIVGPPVYCREIALWDIAGKAAGLPASKMWGQFASRVPAYCATGEVRSSEQRVEDCRRILAEGFKAVKLRFHSDDHRDDIQVVEAIRKELGDRLAIMVDANQAGLAPGFEGHRQWSFRTAVERALELERLGVVWLEEPLPRHDYDGLRRLRDRLGTLLLAGGENNHGVHEFKLLIDRECYDVLQPDAVLSEGVYQMRKIAALAEAPGLLIAPHTWTP